MANRKYTPNWARISSKLTKMLKDRIKQLALIDTGLMLESIYVDYKDTTLIVHAEEYFKYHDGNYNIVEGIINGREFQSYIENVLVEEIEYDIMDFNKKGK